MSWIPGIFSGTSSHALLPGGARSLAQAASEQIDLDDEDEDGIQQKAVPAGVFGGGADGGGGGGMGALERFRKAQG